MPMRMDSAICSGCMKPLASVDAPVTPSTTASAGKPIFGRVPRQRATTLSARIRTAAAALKIVPYFSASCAAMKTLPAVSRNAGSVHLKAVLDNGWGEYVTKAVASPDPTYFLSIDFHRL